MFLAEFCWTYNFLLLLSFIRFALLSVGSERSLKVIVFAFFFVAHPIMRQLIAALFVDSRTLLWLLLLGRDAQRTTRIKINNRRQRTVLFRRSSRCCAATTLLHQGGLPRDNEDNGVSQEMF